MREQKERIIVTINARPKQLNPIRPPSTQHPNAFSGLFLHNPGAILSLSLSLSLSLHFFGIVVCHFSISASLFAFDLMLRHNLVIVAVLATSIFIILCGTP